jgi:hypothetical protein
LGEDTDFSQGWGRRWAEFQLPIPLVPGPVGDEQVDVGIDIEAAPRPLQHRDPRDASLGTAALLLPLHDRFIHEPHRGIEDGRPEGEEAADLEGQAHHHLPVRHVG